MTERRLTLQDAAQELGITPDALRQRIRRGQYHSTKEEGRVYVYLNLDRTETEHNESNALISEIQARVQLLEQELERAHERDRENRRIIAALTQRIPEIEAPSEPTESSETATEQEAELRPGGGQEGAQRPWWRRWFGG
jgi:predicted transcriptional regulator